MSQKKSSKVVVDDISDETLGDHLGCLGMFIGIFGAMIGIVVGAYFLMFGLLALLGAIFS